VLSLNFCELGCFQNRAVQLFDLAGTFGGRLTVRRQRVYVCHLAVVCFSLSGDGDRQREEGQRDNVMAQEGDNIIGIILNFV
jgi:hypothetical protein